MDDRFLQQSQVLRNLKLFQGSRKFSNLLGATKLSRETR